jgi:molecular chaperone DnaJ
MIGTTCPTCRGEGTVVKHPCSGCRGSGLVLREESLKVTVPPGVDDGATLRLSGKGEPGPRGGAAGNLYVVLHVEEHARIKREGADLYVEQPITFAQAALGDVLEVESFDGAHEVTVEPGTQPGHVVVLKGLGAPKIDGRGRGNLYVRLAVQVPTKLSARQEELIRELATEEGQRLSPVEVARGLFGRKKRKS